MTEPMDVSKLVAEIDQFRNSLLIIEEDIASHADRVNRRGGCDEDFRRIGEQERKAIEIRAPLTKLVERLRIQAPDAFKVWMKRNQDTLRALIMKEVSRLRPAVTTVEEALVCITRDANYSNDDLMILRLSGYIEEWNEVASGKRPYALNPSAPTTPPLATAPANPAESLSPSPPKT